MLNKVIEERSKVLSLIKKITVEFFIIVFVIGFFSKSIVNYFLPKVTYEPVVTAKIIKTVDIEGFLEPNQIFKVRLGSNVIVDEYMVKKGEYIDKGQPIFKINDKYGIRSSKEEIEDLEIKLEKEKMNLNKFTEKLAKDNDIRLVSLKEQIDIKKEELKNSEKLYASGAISSSNFEKEKQALRQLELNLELEENRLKESDNELYIQIKDAQNNIKKIKESLKQLQSRQEFYSEVESDHIYYSNTKGVITEINDTDTVLSGDDAVAQIGKIEDASSIKFVGYVDQRDEDLIQIGDNIRLQISGMNDSLKATISSISGIVDNEMLRIEGVFDKDTKAELKLGQKCKATITREAKGDYVISKSSIVPDEELKPDNEGKVYLLEVKNGILGKEYIATEVKVKILDVGDEKVAVYGLEGYKKPNVIKNLSYKIRDGEKVFLWE